MKSIKSYIFVCLLLMGSLSQYFAQPEVADVNDLKYCREKGIFSGDKQTRRKCLFTIFEKNDKGALPYLIERISTEPEEDVQMFIARIIQKLDEVEGIRALEKVAWGEGSFKVRWICRSICKEFSEKNGDMYSFNLARLDERLKLDRPSSAN